MTIKLEVFFLKSFVKLKKSFLIKGSPFGKKIQDTKKYFFYRKIKLFLFESIVYSLSFILRYITIVYVNFSNFDLFFSWIFSFFATVLWQPTWSKIKFIKCWFWCLWTTEDQKTRWKSFLGFRTSSHALELAQTNQGP